MQALPHQLLADIVLVLHALVVVFIVGGLLLIVAGNPLRWRWVNHWWFRATHLAAIGIVAAESWLGMACPLTWLEVQLRIQAQQSTYSASFIEHWLQRLLYYQAPAWAFVVAYTAFGLLVAACWWAWPPRRRHPP